MGFLSYSIFFVIACIASDSVRAGLCTEDEVMKCLEGIDMQMKDPTKVDLNKICGIVPCLDNLECEINEQVKATYTAGIKEMASACEGVSAGCSIGDMQKCMGDLDITKLSEKTPNDEEMKKLCPIRDCLAKILPNCKGELKTKMSTTMSGFDKYCKPGCTYQKLSVCQKEIMDLPDGLGDVTTKHCEVLQKASECAKPFVDKCDGDVRENLNHVITFADCCEDVVNTKAECFPDDSLINSTVFDINHCAPKEKSYSCFTSSKLSCKGDMDKWMDEAKDKMRMDLKECQKNGYNVTVSLEQKAGKDGGNGGMRLNALPSGAILLGMILALAAFWF